MNANKSYPMLSDRQRQAYELREQRLTYQKIGEQMGISAGSASQAVHLAQHRLREYEAFCRWKEENSVSVNFPLTRGELTLLLDGARNLRLHMLRHAARWARTDWVGRLPYEFDLLEEVIGRASAALSREE